MLLSSGMRLTSPPARTPLKLAGKAHPKEAAGSKQEQDTRGRWDPLRLTPTELEKYLCVFLNRPSEIYSLSWVMVCLHWLRQSRPARQTPAPNLNSCDCVVCSRWTQLNKSAWTLNLFLSTCIECLEIWKRGWMRKHGCSEEHKPGALIFQISVLLFNFFVLAWQGWRENHPCSEFVPCTYFLLLFLPSCSKIFV